jgi:coatomer subunit beta'
MWSIKFIAGEQWFAAGDDNGVVHVYAYTFPSKIDKKVKELEAYHDKRVSHLAVYPKHTLLLTASLEGKRIKLWDWSQGWMCARVIDTHDSVYHLKVGPRDASTFASTNDFGNNIVEVCLARLFLFF